MDLIPYYGLGVIVEDDAPLSDTRTLNRVKSHRHQALAAGKCASCNTRPRALNAKTGKPINYCRVCADRFNAAQRGKVS